MIKKLNLSKMIKKLNLSLNKGLILLGIVAIVIVVVVLVKHLKKRENFLYTNPYSSLPEYSNVPPTSGSETGGTYVANANHDFENNVYELPITGSQTGAPTTQNGLRLNYYILDKKNGNIPKGEPILTENINQEFDYNWKTKQILNSNKKDNVYLIFEGYLKLDNNRYIRARYDDGVKLIIDGEEIINDLKYGRARTRTINLNNTNIDVNQDKVPFELHYFDSSGYANLKLEWSEDDLEYEVIPTQAFFLDDYELPMTFSQNVYEPTTTVSGTNPMVNNIDKIFYFNDYGIDNKWRSYDLNSAEERRSLSKIIGSRYLKIFESAKKMNNRPSFRKIYEDFSDPTKLKLNIPGTPVVNLTRRLLSWLSEDDSEHRTDFLEDESNYDKFQEFLTRIYRAKYVVWLGEDNNQLEWDLYDSIERSNLTLFFNNVYQDGTPFLSILLYTKKMIDFDDYQPCNNGESLLEIKRRYSKENKFNLPGKPVDNVIKRMLSWSDDVSTHRTDILDNSTFFNMDTLREFLTELNQCIDKTPL